MFSLQESCLKGCYQVQPRVFDDERGRFVKVFHLDEFDKLGLETNFRAFSNPAVRSCEAGVLCAR